jgi:hypothetical protein
MLFAALAYALKTTFYTTGMEHSPTSATGPRGSRHRGTTQVAAWVALLHIERP